MSDLDIIRKEFSKAFKIGFYKPEKDSTAPIIALVFNVAQAYTAYNLLLKFASSKTTILQIKRGERTMDINILDREKRKSVLIRNLAYSKSHYEEFITETDNNRTFGFIIGIDSAPRPIIISTRKDFKIITLAGYEIL